MLNFRSPVSRLATTANVEPPGSTLQKVVLINEHKQFSHPFVEVIVEQICGSLLAPALMQDRKHTRLAGCC